MKFFFPVFGTKQLNACFRLKNKLTWTIFVKVLAAEAKSESSEVEEVAEAKETTEELAPETASNEDMEPKQENVEESNGSQRTFTYEQLKTRSGIDVAGIDLKRREVSRFVLIFYIRLKLVWNISSPPEICSDIKYQNSRKGIFNCIPLWRRYIILLILCVDWSNIFLC